MKTNVLFYLKGIQTPELYMTTATFTVSKYYHKALGDVESSCGAKQLNNRLLLGISLKE